MELRSEFNAGYLLDQLLRTLAAKGSGVARTFRPGVRLADLLALPGFVDKANQVPSIAWWFRRFDGQAKGAPPLVETRGWRAVSAAEAISARKKVAPVGKRREWIPLFVDHDKRYVCWAGEDAPRLRYLDDGPGRPPALDNLLAEALEALDWREQARDPTPQLPLGAMLEDIDALMRVYAEQRHLEVGFAPGASATAQAKLARSFDLKALPEDLALWFGWHDGEAIERSARTLGIHDNYLMRALGVEPAREAFERLMDADEDIWNAAWLPLLMSREGEHWGYVLAGERAGSIVYSADEEDGAPHVAWPSLASFVAECITLLRRALEHPELQVPKHHHITDEQRRVLAIGGVLTQINGERTDLLGGERRGVGAVTAHGGLTYWWGVVDGDDACQTAERLLAPHEARFAAGPVSDVPDSVAFDLGRVHYVVGNAYVSTLIDAERAWGFCVRAARIAQVAYPSWQAFGEAYATSRLKEVVDDDDDESLASDERHHRTTRDDGTEAVARLLAPGGAWHGLAWTAPLGEPAPPVLPDPTPTVVSTTDELRAAIAAAPPGGWIALEPGTYSLQLTIADKCLWFVARGEGVVWQAEGSQSCIMEELGQFASFDGITFRARGPLQAAPATCVHVEEGLLVFRRCHFEAVSFGIVVASDATAFVEDCVFACAEEAVTCAEDGHLVMRDCTIADADVNGISLDGATARIRRCHVEHAGGHALSVTGGSAVVEELAVAHTGLSGIALIDDASLHLHRSSVGDTGQSGILIQPGASLHLSETRIARAGSSGVLALGAASVTLVGSHVSACAENAVLVKNCRGFTRMLGCELDDSGLALVAIVGEDGVEPNVAMKGCKLGASREYASVYASHCALVMADCVLARSPLMAMHLEHTRGSLSGVKLLGAVERGVVVSESSRLTIEACAIADVEVGVFVAAGARVVLRDCEITRCKVGVVSESAELVASACTVTTIETRAFEVHTNSTAVIVGCTAAQIGGIACMVHESKCLIADVSIDVAKFGVCASGGTVEARRLRIGTTTFAGFEADERTALSIYDSRVEAPGESAIFAHDGARVLAEGCRLVAANDVCCEVSDHAHLTLRGSELVPGSKGPATVDKTSKLVEGKAQKPRTLGWTITRDGRGSHVRTELPPLADDEPWQRRLMVMLELLDPELRDHVYVDAVEGVVLHASAPDDDRLRRLEALVARVRTDRTLAQWVLLAAEAPRLQPPAALASVVRAIARAGATMPRGERRRLVMHGWSIAIADTGASITVAVNADAESYAKARETLASLGPSTATLDGGTTWITDGAEVRLELVERPGGHAVVASVRWP